MNVCICTIGKCENRYIREFVAYYKDLGIDKIFLYDNNDIDGESFEDSISDYIINGFVTVINFRGKRTISKNEKIQLNAYNHCYKTYGEQFEWICFFDIDEYLILPSQYSNIKEWLLDDKFKGYELIQVNWKCYGDNELLYYEDKPLMERFTVPCNEYILDNYLRKSIVKPIDNKLLWDINPHCPKTALNACNGDGVPIKNSRRLLVPPNFAPNSAYIRHFITKTIEEYVEIKMKRGYPDNLDEDKLKLINENSFFKFNKRTPEKEKIYKEKYEELFKEV